MFCPKCGNAEQTPETYCRRCGCFLPDFEKGAKRRQSPEDHIKANAFLNLLTAVTSLTLAILLYAFFLGREETPPIIYITAGFLTAITAWQAQTFWRTMLLRNHFKKQKRSPEATPEKSAEPLEFQSPVTRELLPEADFDDHVPASVVERTTRKLKVKTGK